MMKPVILLGSGGHARVLLDILNLRNIEVLGYTDIKESKYDLKIKYIGCDDDILRYSTDKIMLVNGIGSTGDNALRKKIYTDFKHKGYSFLTLIHPSAVIAKDVTLHEGVQVMAGAILQTGVTVGANSIVNTRASIDHDCLIGESVHIAPGVTLSGNVTIEEDVHIGTGASVIQNVSIQRNSIVGAGAVVIRDVPPFSKVVGIPAKEVT